MNFAALKRLGVESNQDLLNHLPIRYIDYSNFSDIAKAGIDKVVTIKGRVDSLKNIFTRRGLRMQIGSVSDLTGKITIVWFNQPFLAKALYPGRNVALSGKVTLFSGRPALVSPEYEILTENHDTTHTGRLIAIYPETAGISSKWLRTRIRKIFETQKIDIEEFLPQTTLAKYDLTDLKTAYKSVHFPDDIKESGEGRKRLAFNELLFLQLTNLYKKISRDKTQNAYKLNPNRKLINEFINNLPFELTEDQKKAIDEILTDLAKPTPMNRLLEGDVGSGKTVVAATAAFASFINGYQSIFMAPTQILAQQHFETLQKLFKKYKVRISLLTAGTKKVEVGRSDIFVGTHALIHSKLDFEKIALVVIDEQHRFGVEQRRHLIKKSKKKLMSPNVLTMTATPIPRTVSQILHGDLDLSILIKMPEGRQKTVTWIIPQAKRKGAYSWIEKQIKEKRVQAFIICPLIEESLVETMQDIKAVTTELENLKKIFKNLRVGLLHGRMKVKEKNETLSDFRSQKIDILVSTPVVEVGIDIPNATIMIIEASERFGLAQLHQLRGRVGRGEEKSYCLLFSNIGSSRRLTAMTKIDSGFELSELDLKLRGPGEIFGIKQSGFPELKAADWSDADLIKQTRELAVDISQNPSKYPSLKTKLDVYNL